MKLSQISLHPEINIINTRWTLSHLSFHVRRKERNAFMKSGPYCRLTKKKKPYENFKRREKYTKIMNLHALITQLQGHEFMANLISSLYTRSPDSWVFWSNPRITPFHLEIFWYLSLKHEDSFFEPLSHTINFPWFILSLLPSSPLSLPSFFFSLSLSKLKWIFLFVCF